jgi:hypothetical protein
MPSQAATSEANETMLSIREFEKRRKNQIVPILSPRAAQRRNDIAAQDGTVTNANGAIPVGTLQDVRDAMTLMKRAGVSGIQKTSITHREFLIDGVAFRNYPCVPVRLSPSLSFAKTIVELRRNPFTCELRRRMPVSSILSPIGLHAFSELTLAWAKRCTKERGIPYRSFGSMGDTPRGFQSFFSDFFSGKCVSSIKDATEWYALVCDGLMEQLPFQTLACKLLLVLCMGTESSRDYLRAFFSIGYHLVLSKARTLTVHDIVALIASCETLMELNGLTDPDASKHLRSLRDESAKLCELQGTRLEVYVNEMAEGINRRCPLLKELLDASEAERLSRAALDELMDMFPVEVAVSSSAMSVSMIGNSV